MDKNDGEGKGMKLNTVLNVLILLAIISNLLGLEVDIILVFFTFVAIYIGLIAIARGVTIKTDKHDHN